MLRLGKYLQPARPVLFFVGVVMVITAIFFIGRSVRQPTAPSVRSQNSPIPTDHPAVLQNPFTVTVVQRVVGRPRRLEIPSIKVDAVVDDTGLTDQGAMGIPVGPTTTAWFSPGPRPGEIGSAVIDGHYGWVGGVPAVFDRLQEVLPGAKILIHDEAGKIITFTVREIQTYTLHQGTTEIFRSTDGRSHLNLITCEGAWNAATKSYPKRLVVFADGL